MEKDFIPQDRALRLNKLGFDEPCLRGWDIDGVVWYHPDSDIVLDNPTFSQAFRWFREKYGLDCSFEDDIVEDDDDKEIQMWDFFIYKTRQKSDNKVIDFCSNNFNTYIESYTREEAELACLDKLLEIAESL